MSAEAPKPTERELAETVITTLLASDERSLFGFRCGFQQAIGIFRLLESKTWAENPMLLVLRAIDSAIDSANESNWGVGGGATIRMKE